MRMLGSEIIVECLREAGVDTVFGYPGGAILPLYDALRQSAVRHVLTVHEQGAAHAADGYARASGRTGVCIATSGPGATNLVTGLATAFMDSVPVVAITGQVPTMLIGRDAFQEVDIAGITMPVTKHNFVVKDAAKLADMLRQAFRIAASGRPGPVLIDIPRDIQTAEIEFSPQQQPKAAPRESQNWLKEIQGAAEAVKQAQRPLIIAGGGAVAAGVSGELIRLAERGRIPVASTLMGLGAFPASHKHFLGMTGMHGPVPANNAVKEADVIIVVGSRFSDRATGDPHRYNNGKTIIQIDVDPAEIHKNIDVQFAFVGDMPQILEKLCTLLEPAILEAWWQRINGWRRENQFCYCGESLNVPWIMQYIAAKTADRPCIFVTDVGQHQMWAAQHLKIEVPRTWLTSGGLGTMGFGLPAAIGAQFAAEGKRVVHFAGDGGFKMTGAELYTVAAHKLPIISVILNNQCLGMIRQLQHVFFERRYTECMLPPVNFTAFAAAFGVSATETSAPAEFAAAFDAALEAAEPTVLIANIAADALVQPMTLPGMAVNQYVKFEE